MNKHHEQEMKDKCEQAIRDAHCYNLIMMMNINAARKRIIVHTYVRPKSNKSQ